MKPPKKATSKSEKLRKTAELLLDKKREKSKATFSKSENLSLIHELEVHQVELEMQNEELKQARDKAEQSEKNYTELYDFAPSGHLSLSREGEITNLNISTELLLGKKRDNLIKSSFGFFVSPDTRATYNSFLQKAFNTRSKETCELKLETGKNRVKYVIVNGIVSNTGDKCLVTLVDITRRKHIEFELIKARDKAEENERLKSSFLANMSHEIRTPMNGILGFTDLLKDLKIKGEEQQNYIDLIEKSGTRMLNIINDVINISKIESQQVEISVSETNVNDQIEYIYHFFKLEAGLKNLHLSFNNELPAKEAFIMTDREKVYAVLTNLVKNAIKFTQSGSVELGYSKKEEFLKFYVKDSGPGIPEDQQEIIFGRFMQNNKDLTRIYEGAGLGLSISKAYVEMLGGKIWVENNTDKNGKSSGSTFYFTVPAIPVKKKKQVRDNHKTEDISPDKTRMLNILVVENDEISKMLINTMIEDFSQSILSAGTGVEAIEVCRKNPEIDLVLMDINMPEMDGYEATRKIRHFNKEVIIISQTAYALAGDKEKSIDAGCNDYISKPIDRNGLIRMIKNHFTESIIIQ